MRFRMYFRISKYSRLSNKRKSIRTNYIHIMKHMGTGTLVSASRHKLPVPIPPKTAKTVSFQPTVPRQKQRKDQQDKENHHDRKDQPKLLPSGARRIRDSARIRAKDAQLPVRRNFTAASGTKTDRIPHPLIRKPGLLQSGKSDLFTHGCTFRNTIPKLFSSISSYPETAFSAAAE